MLSTYPTRPRLSPGLVAELIERNVEGAARVVSLDARDYASVVRHMASLGLSGGVIYDALIARAAQKGGADKLLTLNPRDLLRVWPDGREIVAAP